MVLQKVPDEGRHWQKSGCSMENLPEWEDRRCVFVGKKVDKEQN